MLFCDVQGSSAMAERLDPEDWAEIMNSAFGYLTRPVLRYQGTVARLMGDGFLAFFGAPVAHEDDPVRAVLAGLDIVDGIQVFRKQIAREYSLDFNVRIGLNTGPVVVGAMGTALAGEYTAMGDAANLAARMEQTAQAGTVQISEHTYQLVSAHFECEPLGSVDLKGREDQVRCYRVIQRKEIPGRTRGIAGLESPLVGRDAEFAKLDRALADLLTQGSGCIVGLIGEAGLGKSRLLEELYRQAGLAGLPPTSWIESRGISYDMTRPYGMFVQQLRQIHAVRSGDSPQVVHQKVADFFSNLEPEQMEAFFQVADLLLELRAGSNGDDAVDGEAVKRQIFAASLELWESLASKTALVLVFDDLHWADPASVDLLLHLFQLVDRLPVLFLCAFRPHRKSPAWQVKVSAETDYPHRYTEITLRPLSDADSGQLVDNLLAIADLPPRLRENMLRKAEGNPFFLEEVVRTLIERGLVQRDPSGLRWQASQGGQEIGIPDNLQTMLLARIDRLEPGARRSLQQASVIGRIFQKLVLQAIADQTGQLDQQLVELQRAELIREAARLPEPEYMFHHELIRDAAYESILKRQRRSYHRRAAQAIEALYPERLSQEAYRLAYHYDQAGDDALALKYYSLAGDTAARLYANQEACEHYEQAIRLSVRLDIPEAELASLYTRRGRALELLNEYDRALENYQELQALGEARGDSSLELAALIPQATIFSTPTVKYDPGRGLELARRAQGLAVELGDHRSEARALWNLMLIEIFGMSDMHQAVAHGEAALAIARQYGLREELAFILHDLARPYLGVSRRREALAVSTEAQQLWRELHNLPMLADNLTSLAEYFYITGEFERSLESAMEAHQLSRETNNLWGEAYSLNTLGTLFVERGEMDQGIQSLEDSFHLSGQAGFAAGIVIAQIMLAWVYTQLGDVQSALKAADYAAELTENWPTSIPLDTIAAVYHELLTASPAEARHALERIGDAELVAVSEIYAGPFILIMDLEIQLANQDYPLTLERAETHLARMQQIGTRLLLPDLLALKSRALLALGQRQEAWQALLEACEIARLQGSRRSLWAVLADLARLASDEQATAAYRREGREVVEFIAGHISDEGLRGKFLALPEVQRLLAG